MTLKNLKYFNIAIYKFQNLAIAITEQILICDIFYIVYECIRYVNGIQINLIVHQM